MEKLLLHARRPIFINKIPFPKFVVGKVEIGKIQLHEFIAEKGQAIIRLNERLIFQLLSFSHVVPEIGEKVAPVLIVHKIVTGDRRNSYNDYTKKKHSQEYFSAQALMWRCGDIHAWSSSMSPWRRLAVNHMVRQPSLFEEPESRQGGSRREIWLLATRERG